MLWGFGCLDFVGDVGSGVGVQVLGSRELRFWGLGSGVRVRV